MLSDKIKQWLPKLEELEQRIAECRETPVDWKALLGAFKQQMREWLKELTPQDIAKIGLIGVICIALIAVLVFGGKLVRNQEPAQELSTAEETMEDLSEGEYVPQNLLMESVEDTSWLTEETTEPTVPEETSDPEETTVPETTVPEETVPETTEAPKVTIDTVPKYFQTDYPDVRYGTGTIATSGCNMTALAMVASYMTDHEYTPDEIADDMAHFIGTHVERLEYGSDLLQLPWERAGNFYDALNALKEGKVVIACMGANSLFTSGQHFIVLTGLNEEGKILVNDPNAKNYVSWNLKDGFENGFREGLILCGFTGAWIYDKNEMPEEPFLYEPEPYAEECRYGDLELTEKEMALIADLLWMEAQSEPFEGQQAIAEVILNRLVSGAFQGSVESVIYAPEQFKSVDRLYLAEPTYTQYKAIERALKGPYVLPVDVFFYAQGAMNSNVWGKIGAHTFCYGY